MKAVAFAVVLSSMVVGIYFVVLGSGREPAAQIAARQAAEGMTRERLAARARGDVASWAAALDDQAVVVPSSGPLMRGREEAALISDRAAPIEAEPARLAVGASRRGRIAWTAMEAGAEGSGAGAPAPWRQSAAFLLVHGKWAVVLEHHARAADWDALRAAAATGRLTEPPTIGLPVERRARSLAKRFQRWMPHLGRARLEREVIALGPTREAFAVGDSSSEVLLSILEGRLGPLRVLPDGLLASVSPGGGSGWVVANLEARPRDWGGAVLPLRVSAVFRSRGEDSWGLALVHLSAEPPDAEESQASPVP